MGKERQQSKTVGFFRALRGKHIDGLSDEALFHLNLQCVHQNAHSEAWVCRRALCVGKQKHFRVISVTHCWIYNLIPSWNQEQRRQRGEKNPTITANDLNQTGTDNCLTHSYLKMYNFLWTSQYRTLCAGTVTQKLLMAPISDYSSLWVCSISSSSPYYTHIFCNTQLTQTHLNLEKPLKKS